MRDGLPVSEDCAIDFHRRTLRSIESAAASQSARFWQQHLPRKSSRGLVGQVWGEVLGFWNDL